MPDSSSTPYERLPGTGYKRLVPSWVMVLLFFILGIFVLLLRGRRVQLWVGDNHLLLVESDSAKEYYKRFYYRDIQAVMIRRTKEGSIVNGLLGLIAGLFIYFTTTVADPTAQISLGSIVLLVGLLLVVNVLAGPTCQCQLRTAVNLTELPSLTRVRQARKALAKLRSRIVAAQGEIPPAEVPSRILELATAPASTPGAWVVDDPNLPPRLAG